MSFSLRDILELAEGQQLKLTAEAAGSLTLATAEQLKQRPRQVVASDVLLESSGTLTINSNAPADPLDADLRLRGLLRDLLSGASSHSPALKHVADAPGRGISTLCEELLAAMVPFNRGAARRGLTRLHRRISELPEVTDASAPRVEPRVLPPTTGRALSVDELPGPVGTQRQHTHTLPQNSVSSIPTPIFGSLPVEFLDSSEDAHDTEIDLVSTELRFTADPASSGALSPLPRDIYNTSKPPPRTPVYHDRESVIIEDEDSVVARNPALPRPGADPIFGTFSPRRSDVSALLGDFGVSAERSVRETTRKLRDSVGVDSDFLTPPSPSISSRTPPPVQSGARRDPVSKPSSRLLSLASVFVAAVAVAWGLRPVAPAGFAAAPAECFAEVQVRSEADSEVRLVSASQQLRRPGPSAHFAPVACDQDAEVIVLLSSRDSTVGRQGVTAASAAPAADGLPGAGSEPPANGVAPASQGQGARTPVRAGWLRVPLPKDRLRSAAKSGKPLVISVFGR